MTDINGPKILITEEMLRSNLGEGFHTAFRKAVDSDDAAIIWRVMARMPREDWAEILNFVMNGIRGGAAEEQRKGLQWSSSSEQQ